VILITFLFWALDSADGNGDLVAESEDFEVAFRVRLGAQDGEADQQSHNEYMGAKSTRGDR
jgi:hypothetical protein